MKALIFLVNPVKSDGQQMLILKVTSENVAKVQKWWLLECYQLFGMLFLTQEISETGNVC